MDTLSAGFAVYAEASAVKTGEEIDFHGKTYRGTDAVAFAVIALCHSLPAVNSRGYALDAATLANSHAAGRFTHMDVEHALAWYGGTSDRLCGSIVDTWFPAKEEAVASQKAGDPVALEVLVAIDKFSRDGERTVKDLKRDITSLCASLEWNFRASDSEIVEIETGRHWAVADAPESVQKMWDREIGVFRGAGKYALVTGGYDGKVTIIGGGFTETPADKLASVESIAASAVRKVINGWRCEEDRVQAVASGYMTTCGASAWDTEDAPDHLFAYVPPAAKGKDGKKSARKFPLGSREKKGLDPAILRNALARLPQSSLSDAEKKAAKGKILSAIRTWNASHTKEQIHVKADAKASDIRIGAVDAAGSDGHTHHIFRDLSAGTGGKPAHSHALRVLDVGPDGISGITEIRSGPTDDNVWEDHMHTWACSYPQATSTGGAANMAITVKAMVETIRALLKDPTAEEHQKALSAVAVDLESGAFIPKEDAEAKAKAVSEEALKKGEEAGAAKVREEYAKAEAEAKAKAAALKARMDAVVAAKLDPKHPFGGERTIESVVASLPVGEVGDKLFAERLDEWKSLKVEKAAASAADDKKVAPLPIGGGDGGRGTPGMYKYGDKELPIAGLA